MDRDNYIYRIFDPLSHVSVITIIPIFLAMIVSQSTAVFLDKERAFHRVNVDSVG